MSKNSIGWFEIYVNDLARARAFYESLLAAEMTPLGDPGDSSLNMSNMLAFPMNYEQYGAGGALVQMDGVPAGGNSTLVYFACDDCAVEESRVEGAGGQVVQSKMSLGEFGFMSLAIDTEGNRIGLHSMA